MDLDAKDPHTKSRDEDEIIKDVKDKMMGVALINAQIRPDIASC